MSAARNKTPPIGEPGWRPSEVHPLAALFPMLEEDDLAALADDIKEHGLRTPIQVDANGRLVDGRNRNAACELAGVEPRYEFINGEDIEALIWSNNGKRRHMSKGQMAMIAAMALSLETKPRAMGGVERGQDEAARSAGVSKARLSQALLVREHAPHLVTDVIAGKPEAALDKAYVTAQANQREKKWRDDGVAMLRQQDKDLAQKVADREMSLEDARKELEQRQRDLEAKRDSVLMGMNTGLRSLAGFDKSEALAQLPVQLRSAQGSEHFRRYFKDGQEEFAAALDDAERGLAALRKFQDVISKKGR